jgi:hypothetical protein
VSKPTKVLKLLSPNIHGFYENMHVSGFRGPGGRGPGGLTKIILVTSYHIDDEKYAFKDSLFL